MLRFCKLLLSALTGEVLMSKDFVDNKRSNKLIERIKSGDSAGFELLREDYSALVTHEVSRFCENLTTSDYDDIKQTAQIALYRAAMSYDTKQTNVSFGLYAKICIVNALLSCRRKMNRADEYSDYSLDALESDNDSFLPGSGDPSELLISKEEWGFTRDIINSALSKYENRVFDMYISGFSYSEIAARLSKTEKSVDNAMCRIKSKLKALLSR